MLSVDLGGAVKVIVAPLALIQSVSCHTPFRYTERDVAEALLVSMVSTIALPIAF
jgi:hypothetical protein